MKLMNIAFIDVLGFKAMIEEIAGNPYVQPKIQKILERFKAAENATRDTKLYRLHLNITSFSDSIVISCEDPDIVQFIHSIGFLYAFCLYDGVLLRGGIARGLMYHQNGILYGPAMIAAYETESQLAKYPRILLMPEFLNHIDPNLVNATCNIYEEDGYCSIDPFKYFHEIFPPMGTPDERDEDEVKFLNNVQEKLLVNLENAKTEAAKRKIEWQLNRIIYNAKQLKQELPYLHWELDRVINRFSND